MDIIFGILDVIATVLELFDLKRKKEEAKKPPLKTD